MYHDVLKTKEKVNWCQFNSIIYSVYSVKTLPEIPSGREIELETFQRR